MTGSRFLRGLAMLAALFCATGAFAQSEAQKQLAASGFTMSRRSRPAARSIRWRASCPKA
jgi:hypothetical protein